MNKGYRFDISEQVRSVQLSRTDAERALAEGEFTRVRSELQEMIDASQEALNIATRLVKLQAENTSRLESLAQEVAEVEAYRNDTVSQANRFLTELPSSNLDGIEGNFGEASQTLAILFDDPANANDLASNVARMNSMENQEFTQADALLDQAFADLETALSQLRAVERRYQEFLRLEGTIEGIYTGVQKAIDDALTRRDAEDRLIDETIDQRLEVVQQRINGVRVQVDNRELIVAHDLLEEIEDEAEDILADANEQIRELSEANRQMKASQRIAREKTATAQSRFSSCISVAQTSEVNRAFRAFEELTAEQHDARIQRLAALEDDELLAATTQLTRVFDRVASAAQSVISAVDSAEASYSRLLSEAQSAVSSANSAVSSARTAVNQSDAQGYGRNKLNRASSAVPSSPSSGETRSRLQQIINQAEQAERDANEAKREANSRASQVQRERAEAERLRQAEIRRQQQLEAQRIRDEERRERERRQALSASTTFGSTTRTSNFGSINRNSNFGSNNRGSNFGGRKR